MDGFDNRSQELMDKSLQPVLSYNERQAIIIANIQSTINEVERLDIAFSIKDRIGSFLQSDPESSESMSVYVKYLKEVRDAILFLNEYNIPYLKEYTSELQHIYSKAMANLETLYRIELTKASQMSDHDALYSKRGKRADDR